MTITAWGTLVLQVSVRVVLEDVVCYELDRVIGARLAALTQGLHDSRRDGLLEVGLCWKIVNADRCLFRHRRELSLTTYLRVSVPTFWIKIILLCRRHLNDLLIHLFNSISGLGYFCLLHHRSFFAPYFQLLIQFKSS